MPNEKQGILPGEKAVSLPLVRITGTKNVYDAKIGKMVTTIQIAANLTRNQAHEFLDLQSDGGLVYVNFKSIQGRLDTEA